MANWVEHTQEIQELTSSSSLEEIPVGGRFIFSSEAEEGPKIAMLVARELTLSDSQQCEIVASRFVATNETAIREAIDDMRRLAMELDVRLISVEAGDFEDGTAIILAAEDGYIPWWHY